MTDFKPTRCVESKLPQEITDGAFYITSDTKKIFIDYDETRLAMTDIVTVASESVLPLAPISGKLYVAAEEQTSWIYYEGSWVKVGTGIAGGGVEYTAGDNIVIENNEISVDPTLSGAVDANTTALGGQSLVKLTQEEYDALVEKDPNTVYIISDGTPASIGIASATQLGGIKVGANLTIDPETGVLSAQAGGSTYTAGNGIDITDDEISIDEQVVATKEDLNKKEDKLTAVDPVNIYDFRQGELTLDWYQGTEKLSPLPETVGTPAKGQTITYYPFGNQKVGNSGEILRISWETFEAGSVASATTNHLFFTGDNGSIDIYQDGHYESTDGTYTRITATIGGVECLNTGVLRLGVYANIKTKYIFTYNRTTFEWNLSRVNSLTEEIYSEQSGVGTYDILPTNSLISLVVGNDNGIVNSYRFYTNSFTVSTGVDIVHNIGLKIDNNTIKVNSNGQLYANVQSGTEYTAGEAIDLTNDEISVKYDDTTIGLNTDDELEVKSSITTAIANNTAALDGHKIVSLTQEEYDELEEKDPDTVYIITDGEPIALGIASTTQLGGIKVGNNLTIDPETGVLSATGGGSVEISGNDPIEVSQGSQEVIGSAYNSNGTEYTGPSQVSTELSLIALPGEYITGWDLKNDWSLTSAVTFGEIPDTPLTVVRMRPSGMGTFVMSIDASGRAVIDSDLSEIHETSAPYQLIAGTKYDIVMDYTNAAGYAVKIKSPSDSDFVTLFTQATSPSSSDQLYITIKGDTNNLIDLEKTSFTSGEDKLFSRLRIGGDGYQISLKYDNDTLKLNEQGQLYAVGGSGGAEIDDDNPSLTTVYSSSKVEALIASLTARIAALENSSDGGEITPQE